MPKRSLILAGGGVKVAFQAGVMQVWLDEAGLEFDHADGASGGCMNLAMWVQGMSGTGIADNWRRLDPMAGIDFNWSAYLRLFFAESLFELDAYRENVFRKGWGLDWEAIRASDREATFNVYDFTAHELRAFEPAEMTEDHLVASISLPMWFPPVVIDGHVMIDSVFVTDANLEEAIRRGADELWIVWTVSERGEWSDGFVANYFQVIETAAVGRFKRDLARIERSNAAIERGEPGEFGRPIEVKLLKAEVPLHYLLNFNRDRIAEAVNRGVEAARAWCAGEGIDLAAPGPDYPTEIHEAKTTVRFRETMKGHVRPGETDPGAALGRGGTSGEALEVRLEIVVDGVDRFITRPEHEASASGVVACDAFGGERPVEEGIFNLHVDEGDPRKKRMRYRLHFTDDAGRPLTLSGVKHIEDDPGRDLWSDTTTLFVRILEGRVGPDEEAGATVVAAGVIRIHLRDFLKQLTTFRATGPTITDRAAALARFGRFFLGPLWDIYAAQVGTRE